MRARVLGLAAAAAAAIGVVPAGASAADHTVYGAGAFLFAPAQVTILQGDTVTFSNLDVMSHNLQSVETTPLGAPLFGSGSPQGFLQSRPVTGVSSLAPGGYTFICVLHQPLMRGNLTVL